MQAAPTCPRTQELEQLLRRTVSPEETAFLARHLDECVACAEALDRALGVGGLGEAFRRPLPAQAPPEDSIVAGLIGRLCELSLVPAQPDSGHSGHELLAPAQAPDELGRIGPYRVLRVLGAGGMGIVFEGEDTRLRRRVALKVMKAELAPSPEARERFLREARAAACLQHDHIVVIHDVGEDRGLPYLAMQLLQGQSLEDRLRDGRPLPVEEVLRVGREIAEGLAAAHARGIVHRDIKPANLWLQPPPGREEEEGDRIVIVDFGLARAALEEVRLTRTGAIAGTPGYLAPEQARGQPADERSDLFSLGCVLYRMSTGQPAFTGADTLALLKAVTRRRPRPPRELNRDVPPALCELVMRLLEKDPGRRPASARAVADALAELPRTKESPPTRPLRLLLLVGILLLALFGGVGWWLARTRPPADGNSAPAGPPVLHPVHHIRFDEGERFVSVDISQDGRFFLATRGNPARGRVWRVQNGKNARELFSQVAARFTPDGDQVITGSMTTFNVGELETAKNLRSFPCGGPVSSFHLSYRGTRLLHEAPGELRVFDWVSGKLLCRIPSAPGSPVLLTPDGRHILTQAGGKPPLRALDADTGKEVDGFLPLRGVPPLVGISGDGGLLLCRQADALKVYEVDTGRETRTFAAGPDAWGVLSGDGRRLVATTGQANELAVWDVADGRLLARLRFPAGEAVAHGSLRASRDGRLLAACGATDSVYVFRLPDLP
jgi:serine/threonine protein kinase